MPTAIFFIQFDYSGTSIWWHSVWFILMQCLLQVIDISYSLFYWNTNTDRLAPKTVIVNISQWQSVLHRSISLSCYISEKKTVVTQFCRLVVPIWPHDQPTHDWKLSRLLRWRPERSRLSSPADKVCRVMFDSCARMPSKNVKLKPCVMQDFKIYTTKYSYEAC